MTIAVAFTLTAVTMGCSDAHSPRASSPEGYEPLATADPEVRRTFARGRGAGASLVVVEITSVEPIGEGLTIGTDEDAIWQENAAEIEATVLASEHPVGDRLAFRVVTDSSCGWMARDRTARACAERNFYPAPMTPGEVWQLGIGPHGAPNTGFWSMMAGRQLPPGSSPGPALEDALRFLADETL